MDNYILDSAEKWISMRRVILVCALLVSGIATLTGFHGLISYSSDAYSLEYWFKAVMAVLVTVIVQVGIYYFITQYVQTRLKRYLMASLVCLMLSVSFAWGLYFDLGNDKVFAQEAYDESRDKVMRVVFKNKELLKGLIEETQELEVNAYQEVELEKVGKGKCNSLLSGYGPRAAKRKEDAERYKKYKEKFKGNRKKLEKIYSSIEKKDRFSIKNLRTLNNSILSYNTSIERVIEDKEVLIEELSQRARHNQSSYLEYFDDGIRKGSIRCPDQDIPRYMNSINQAEPGPELLVVEIADPDKEGVQLILASRSLKKVFSWSMSEPELYTWIFAVAIDFIIIVLASFNPKIRPPHPMLSWSQHFKDDSLPEISKMCSVQGDDIDIYIPVNNHMLQQKMLAILPQKRVECKGITGFWKSLFWAAILPRWHVAPKHIREQSNGCKLILYHTDINSLAQWTLDAQEEATKKNLNEGIKNDT